MVDAPIGSCSGFLQHVPFSSPCPGAPIVARGPPSAGSRSGVLTRGGEVTLVRSVFLCICLRGGWVALLRRRRRFGLMAVAVRVGSCFASSPLELVPESEDTLFDSSRSQVSFLDVLCAYVSGEKQGLLLEKAFSLGETLKDKLYLDIASEIKLLERKKQVLQLENSGMAAEKIAMKELGMERARHFGWTNTYVFTKAMGEMLLGQLRGSLPLVIARPTIITSTWKEPFPGWIEGNGAIDNVIVGYAKGILPCLAIDRELPIDLIPGDMVVNAMIAMAVAHSNQQAEFIYHIGSSVRNPVNYSILDQCMSRYFSKNPLFGEEGKAISMPNVPVFKTLARFHAFIFLRYFLLMEMLRLVNYKLCLFPNKYSNLSQKYGYAMRIMDLYRPYCFVKRCYDDTNLERLRMATKKQTENLIFYFDPKDIDWEDYFYNTHIPGAVKYAAADSVGNIQQLHPIIMDRKSKL